VSILREKLAAYLFMILAVPIAGELKFYPVEGDIRVSLGTPVFFFILLWSRKVHPLIAGVLVGSAVVLFRILVISLHSDPVALEEAFSLHFPVFFYYLIFALLFHLFRLKSLYDKPFLIGLLGVVIEVIASLVEISFRYFFSHMPLTLSALLLIGGIAIIRSFFVLGFFNILIVRETKLAEEQQRRKTEQILLLVSNLYVEIIQLKKSTKNAEELTSACYGLYRDLKSSNHEGAKKALEMAGQMHEIKKDNQRIYAGLSRLMVKENLDDFMNIEEICKIIISSNQSYGDMLGKTVRFELDIRGDHPLYHSFTLLSMINNLISNAVEAIEKEGVVEIRIKGTSRSIQITVTDNGMGISEKNRSLVFEPGFTTKFDDNGYASNGIGLSFIKGVIEHHGGEIRLLDLSKSSKTTFEILLPINSLIQKG
jgi:two-component system sensor histidine kinase YcbA